MTTATIPQLQPLATKQLKKDSDPHLHNSKHCTVHELVTNILLRVQSHMPDDCGTNLQPLLPPLLHC